MRVTWDPLSNIPEITGYKIYYRQLTPGITDLSKNIVGTETRSTVIDGLTTNAAYYIEVVSVASVNGEVFESVRAAGTNRLLSQIVLTSQSGMLI